MFGCSGKTDRAQHAAPAVIAGDIPCAPNEVLQNVCQQCHAAPPKHGAPFSLVTYGDVQTELDGHPIWYWMEQYVEKQEMPLPPVNITDDDRATLLAWLRAGAPPRAHDEVCGADAGSYDAAPAQTADGGVVDDDGIPLEMPIDASAAD